MDFTFKCAQLVLCEVHTQKKQLTTNAVTVPCNRDGNRLWLGLLVLHFFCRSSKLCGLHNNQECSSGCSRPIFLRERGQRRLLSSEHELKLKLYPSTQQVRNRWQWRARTVLIRDQFIHNMIATSELNSVRGTHTHNHHLWGMDLESV